MSTNPVKALETYSTHCECRLENHDRNWASLQFLEDQNHLRDLRHFPFEAVFWAYDYPNKPKLCLHRRKALSIIHACRFQTPQTWQAIALAAQTISTGEVQRILTEAAQYSAVMPVGINPEAPFYYQFGREGECGSLSRVFYEPCKEGGNKLPFVGSDEPSGFRWPVIIGIRKH